MKKIFLFVVVIFTTFSLVLTLSGCGENRIFKFKDDGSIEIGKVDMDNIVVIGADGKEYHSYRTACSNGDFDAAREYVGKMKDKAASVDDHWERRPLEELIEEAEEYIYSGELNALASMNDKQANTRIVLILNEDKAEGTPVNEGANVGIDCRISYDKRRGNNYEYISYMDWVSKYNLKCDRILDIAIACGNKDLAERILHLIRQDATFYYKPTAASHDDRYKEEYKDVYAHYTNDSKEAAQKKYEEAVRNGAFN